MDNAPESSRVVYPDFSRNRNEKENHEEDIWNFTATPQYPFPGMLPLDAEMFAGMQRMAVVNAIRFCEEMNQAALEFFFWPTGVMSFWNGFLKEMKKPRLRIV